MFENEIDTMAKKGLQQVWWAVTFPIQIRRGRSFPTFVDRRPDSQMMQDKDPWMVIGNGSEPNGIPVERAETGGTARRFASKEGKFYDSSSSRSHGN